MAMTSILGSEETIEIKVTGIDNYVLSDIEFNASFYVTTDNVFNLTKMQMRQIDDNTYRGSIDTLAIGVGEVMVDVTLYIPDASESDGTRTKILRADTGLQIIN